MASRSAFCLAGDRDAHEHSAGAEEMCGAVLEAA
jgi:hypothetical protein